MKTQYVWLGLLSLFLTVGAGAKDLAHGTVTGILVKKSEKGIVVKVDGEEKLREFKPRWIGGNPKDGGGLDKKVVESIKKLYPSNLVRVDWVMEEGPRVVNVEMMIPDAKTGTVTGQVIGKGKGYIELKPADGITERYVPHWKGGHPKDGGGLDKTALAAIEKVKVGQTITVLWEYSERKRLVGIK